MQAFDGLLNQSVTIYPKSGRDEYGKPSFGAGVANVCRFTLVDKVKLMPNKQEIVINATASLLPTASFGMSDKVAGPDGNNYRIITSKPAYGRFGDLHHYQLELQLWQI